MVGKFQSNSTKPDQLNDEIFSMPELRLRQKINSIHTSIYIFDRNFAELTALLEFFINDPKSFPLTLQRNRDQLNKMQLEILRLLHNFVAASLTLIDHTRNYYDDLYGDSDKFPDYESRRKTEFENDPLSQFVKGLRKYCQHYYSPNIVIQESFIPNPDGAQSIIKKVLLVKDELMTFDGWSSKAKIFLNKSDKEIDILVVVETYRTKVINFYHWFIDRQSEIHKNALNLVQQKENEFVQSHIEFLIDARINQKDNRATIEEEIFSGIISSKEIVELESFEAPPDMKADFAIILLSRHYPVPELLRVKIIELYRLDKKPPIIS